MAISVIEPPKIAFSNNPIILKFQADGEGVVNGTPSVNAIVLTGPIVDSTRLTVRWNGKEQSLRAVSTPNTLGAEFAAGNGNAAHASALAAWFNANYFFSEDFVVTSGTHAGNPAIIFTAKKVGKSFNFSSGTFSGGSVLNVTTGINREAPINESVFVELWVKKRNDADFVRVFDAPLPLEEDRSASIDLSQEIHAQLETEIPDFNSPGHFYATSSWLSYMVKFGQAGGENFTIGQMGNTGLLFASLGGTSYEAGPGKTPELLLKGAGAATDKLLTLHGFHRVIRTGQPVFAGFLNVRQARASSTLRLVLTFSDNTTQTINRPDAGPIALGEKIMWPVGYDQLSLGTLQPSKIIVSYTVQLFTGSTAISDIYTYLIDYSVRKQIRYFSYTNSLGVPDTLYCYGEGSSELKIFRDQAEHVLRYDYEIPQGTMSDWDLQTQELASCSSGFIPFRYVTYFHDFFLSQKKHRLISGAAYPISVNSDSLKKWSDNDNQFAIAFDYQYNFRNRQVSFADLEKELVSGSEQMPSGLVPGGSTNYTPPIQEATDNAPTQGSLRPISSHAVWQALQGLQTLLATGTGNQILLGNGHIVDAETFINAFEKDSTVPPFLKTITDSYQLLNKIKEVHGSGSGLDSEKLNGRTLSEVQDAEGHTLDNLDNYASETGLPTSSDNVLSAIAKIRNKLSAEPESNKAIRFHDLPIQYLAKNTPLDKTLNLLPYLFSDDNPSDLRIRAIQNEHAGIGLNARRTLGLSVLLSGRITENISPDYNPIFVVIENYITGNQITVGLPISTVQIEESVPDFIVDLMITFQASTNDTTIHAITNRNIKMIVAGVDGPDPHGLDHAFQPWSINEWNLGTTEYTEAPVTELFRFNPPANKFDGINPDTEYLAWVAQEDDPQKIYQFKFRTPAGDQLTPVSILPEAEPQLPACDLGPTLLGISAVTPGGLSFNFDGNNVFGIAWRIKDAGTTVRSGVDAPTSSVVPITFAPLPPKTYVLEIEGSTCSSAVEDMEFTITGGSTTSFTLNLYTNNSLKKLNFEGGIIQLPISSWDIRMVKPTNPNYGHVVANWFAYQNGEWLPASWWKGPEAVSYVSMGRESMSAENSIIPIHPGTSLPATTYSVVEDGIPGATKPATDAAEFKLVIQTLSGNASSPVVETRTVQFQISTAPAPGPSTANKNVLPISSPNGAHKMEVITGGRVELTISNDGAITDTWPDIYTNGQRSLEILGNLHHVYYTINGPELANLNGVILPEGDYFIEKYYVLASHFPTFQAMRNAPWELTNDRIAERVSIQMRVGSTGNIAKPTFYPEFVKSGTPVGDHKISGYKNMWVGVSHADMFSHGSTHDLNTGGYDFSIPSQRSFALIKLGSTGLSPNNSEQDFYNAGWNYCNATGNTPEQLVFEELGEEWDNLPGGGAGKRPKIVKFFEGYRDAMIEAHPGMQLGEFNSFGGYGGLENLGEPQKIWDNPARLAGYRQHLSSTEQARKRYDPGNVGFANDDHDYFTSGESAVFNVCFRIYFFNASNLSGEFLPQFLYESETMYIAEPDNSQMVFTWEMIQDMVNHVAHKNGWWYYSSSPAGRLYVGNNSFDAIPPYIAHDTAFFSCLNMKGYAVWGDRSDIGDVEVSGNQTTIFGRVKEDSTFEYIGGTRLWKPDGGSEVTWEISNPTHIARDGATGQFSKYPLTGLDAFDRGRRDYDSIHPLVGEKHWAKFSVNGGSTWYTPNPGSLGTRLSSYGAPNFNTANPVLDIFANKQGVAIICVTGSTVTCIYKNTFRTVLQTENVIFQWEGKNYNLGTCRGTTLYVRTFDK